MESLNITLLFFRNAHFEFLSLTVIITDMQSFLDYFRPRCCTSRANETKFVNQLPSNEKIRK